MHNPFKRFIQKIASPKKPIEDVKGLYLGNNHFIRVVPQPEGNPEYVSSLSGVATRFQLPTQFGNIGLIAHNYLSGKHFLELKPGDSLYIMDGFKRRKRYVVKSIHRYQALQPQSPHSHFIDLDTQDFDQGMTRKLAAQLKAPCYLISELKADRLAKIIRKEI